MNDILIEIKQDTPGFNSFFGSWVCLEEKNIVIDVGPANTAGRLIGSLETMGLDRVDYVFLTHIHIDHSGGLADMLDHYPTASVICHEKAVKHLVEPSRLWDGSLKVLGKIAEAYGQPRPVSEDRLIPHTQNELKDLMILETPGHAVHHLSFNYKNRLFVGEAGGNYLLVENNEYLRPATPPRFFLDVCLKSVDRLLAMNNQPIRYAHFGQSESSHRLLRMYRDQLITWKKIIHETTAGAQKGDEELVARCMEALLEKDPNLTAFKKMDRDTRKRERFFMANAIEGFIGFLEENKQEISQ